MAHIQIRISHDDKKSAKIVLDQLGLTFSGAIKLFFKQMVREGGLPFNISTTEIDAQIKSEIKTPEKKVSEPIKKEAKVSFANMLSPEDSFSAKKIR